MKIFAFALCMLCFTGIIRVKADTSGNSPLYTVSAEIKEVKNRILECTVRDHKIIVDQPKSFGADDLGPTPPEMLALAYGSCVVSTMQFVALQRNLKISGISVKIEGTIDYSKAMGISDANRAGFSGFKLKIAFKSDMTPAQKQAFMANVFKMGAVIDNVDNTTPVTYEIEG